jgi:prolyl-tRNA synthetase
MRQSQLFTKTLKNISSEETSKNAILLLKAGYINKVAAGVYTFLPLGLRVIQKISNIIREEMNKVGGQEILMPALCPKDLWQTTNRWDTFDALFKLEASDSRQYALGATHEEVVVPLLKQYISSYKDLPVAVYQIQNKFRNEKRAKAGLLRGREFLMKDMYSFHLNQEDLDNYYNKVIQAYFKIYQRLGLAHNTYLTYASGGDFSKYSHEFQTECISGEDDIYLCQKCKVAVNQEIIKEQNVCPECGNKELLVKKAIEVGNIFKLGTRFSQPFKLQSEQKDIIMGCYGLGLSRVMGAIVEVKAQDNKIIWPESLVPFKVHLIDLNCQKESDEIYRQLINSNIEVLYDDRENVRAGEKFMEADLIGCQYRLVISPKTLEKGVLELKKNDEEELKLFSKEEIINILQ